MSWHLALAFLALGADPEPVGELPHDLLGYVNAARYFEYCRIDVTADSLMRLAAQEPSAPKIHARQLMALKTLADRPELLRKSAKLAEYRQTLEAIAAGKKAQDRVGFARDYACRALAKLDGVKLGTYQTPPRTWEESVRWFPKETTFVAGGDVRGIHDQHAARHFMLRLQSFMVAQAGNEFFKLLDKVGNIQFDRLSMAYAERGVHAPVEEADPLLGETPRKAGECYYRLTGKFHHDWLLDLWLEIGETKLQRVKGAQGEPIAFLKPRYGPCVGLVGDTDMIFADADYRLQNGQDRIMTSLLTRSGQKPSVLKGPLGATLKKIPAGAFAFAAGDIPEELGNGDVPAPRHILAHLTRTPHGTDCRFELYMDAPEKAAELARDLLKKRLEGLAALQQFQATLSLDSAPLVRTLRDVQLRADDCLVSGSIFVTDDAILAVPLLFFEMLR